MPQLFTVTYSSNKYRSSIEDPYQHWINLGSPKDSVIIYNDKVSKIKNKHVDINININFYPYYSLVEFYLNIKKINITLNLRIILELDVNINNKKIKILCIRSNNRCINQVYDDIIELLMNNIFMGYIFIQNNYSQKRNVFSEEINSLKYLSHLKDIDYIPIYSHYKLDKYTYPRFINLDCQVIENDLKILEDLDIEVNLNLQNYMEYIKFNIYGIYYNFNEEAILIQKVYRGWIVRKRYRFNPTTTLGNYLLAKIKVFIS